MYDQIWRRHADQILECTPVATHDSRVPEMLETDISPSTSSTEVTSKPNVAERNSTTAGNDRLQTEEMVLPEPKRYPQWERKPPDRLTHEY